jgi:hypothetical protein
VDAAYDAEIVDKIKGQLANGKTAVITSGGAGIIVTLDIQDYGSAGVNKLNKRLRRIFIVPVTFPFLKFFLLHRIFHYFICRNISCRHRLCCSIFIIFYRQVTENVR